jgi:nucleophosmin 1
MEKEFKLYNRFNKPEVVKIKNIDDVVAIIIQTHNGGSEKATVVFKNGKTSWIDTGDDRLMDEDDVLEGEYVVLPFELDRFNAIGDELALIGKIVPLSESRENKFWKSSINREDRYVDDNYEIGNEDDEDDNDEDDEEEDEDEDDNDEDDEEEDEDEDDNDEDDEEEDEDEDEDNE